MSRLSVFGLCLGGVTLMAGTATYARRAFLEHVDALERSVEQVPKVPSVRIDLPDEVLALARRLGASDNGDSRVVLLTQSGEMHFKPGSKPLAFEARQSIAVAEIGFLWQARFFMMPGISMRVIDYTVNGKSGLEGRLFGALPIVHETDTVAAFRGETMRYLAELFWNPDALLVNPHLEWRVINARTLEVAIGAGSLRSEVRLMLDEAGDVVRIEAEDRPCSNGPAPSVCPWFGRAGDYRMINGRSIPFQAEAGWILDGVEFVYWRGRIKSWSQKA